MQQAPRAIIPTQFATTTTIPQTNAPIVPQITTTQPLVPTIPRPVVPRPNQPIIPQPPIIQPVVPPITPQVPVVQPIVPQFPQRTTVNVPTPLVATVPVPVVVPTATQTTIPMPVVVPQLAPTTPAQTQPVLLQTTTPVTRQVAQPAQPAQGGILRQFGGGGVGFVAVTTVPQTTAAPVVNIIEETGYSLLTQLLQVWNGTDEQARQLATLQYENGNYIVDANRRDVILEIVGMLRNQPFDDIIDFLTDAPNPEYVLWEQESMDEGRIKVIRELAIQQAEEVGVKGVGKCRYCPSTELVFATRQTRSADEAMTIFVRCVMCHKQWRQ